MKVHNEKKSHEKTSAAKASTPPHVKGKRVSRKKLINQINLTHFQGRSVTCRIDHNGRSKTFVIPVNPRPVFGSHFVGLWPDDQKQDSVKTYSIKAISIPCGKDTIDFIPDVRSISPKGFCIDLPEGGRKTPNPYRRDTTVLYDQICVRIHNGEISALATLVTIEHNTLTLHLATTDQDEVPVFTLEDPLNLAFIKNGSILFTGQFIPVNMMFMPDRLEIILRPTYQVIHRFPPKKFRSPRHILEPAPDADFISPFHGEFVSLAVHDISGSGFSVIHERSNSGLLTGMILNDLELNFSGAFSITCSAQMVHRSVIRSDDGKQKAICGFAFIDMTLDDHLRLSRLLHRKSNPNIRICNRENENDLWSFFFETGFIYAQKYRHFLENKDRIKATYRKLYSNIPVIARHFIYKKKGQIVGHLSMLRLYRDSWLIHHHAALRRSSVKAGLDVLNHLAWFCYNSMWLEACHMRYMMCYFRPENTFPEFFFNGFAERLNDPAGCSTDIFAYTTYRGHTSIPPELPEGFRVSTSSAEDLETLKTFYMNQSGGLLIDSLDLSPDYVDDGELTQKYRDAGLSKKRFVFSLKKNQTLKAVLLVNITDVAINMSDLTNCITLFVVDPTDLTRENIQMVFGHLAPYFEQSHFPVMLYPLSFAEKIDFNYEKRYILWILSTKYSDHYFQFLDEVNALALNSQRR